MADYWWQDLCDRDNNWLGLEIIIKPERGVAADIEIVSGHHGRTAMMVNGQPLFWATMLKDHSAVWLIFNADHEGKKALLPPVTSSDVETVKKVSGNSLGWWCRYFAKHLFSSSPALLPARRWLLRPMTIDATKQTAKSRISDPPEKWHYCSPVKETSGSLRWELYGEDICNLFSPEKVRLVDWWWRGELLLGRYGIRQDEGRLKWWRKKAREGTLPPILLLNISGFSSYIILDGHYRLQAALAEGIPPRFLVLSELAEKTFPENVAAREKIEKSLAIQQKSNPDFEPARINTLLINLYDRFYYLTQTTSRAVLGNGDTWAEQVSEYLHKHNLTAHLPEILARENRDSEA